MLMHAHAYIYIHRIHVSKLHMETNSTIQSSIYISTRDITTMLYTRILMLGKK